jgi:hypothetical protein
MGAPYSSTLVSNYNVNPPPDDGSTSPQNRVQWANDVTKIGNPIKTALEANVADIEDGFGKVIGGATFVNTGVSYVVLAADQGKEIRATASGITITTPDCTVVGAPFMFAVQNASTGTVTVAGSNPGVQQNVDGVSSTIIQPGAGAFLNTDGTNWFTVGANFTKPVPPPASFKNLSVKVTDNTHVALVADFIVVTDGNGSFQTLAYNQSINLGTTGANALDTGSIAIDTWYAIWAIAKPDGTVAGLASTSSTSPTMPSGYTYKARVSWAQTIHSSATLYGTWQLGRVARYIVGLAQTTSNLPNIINSANTAWTAQSVTRFVPPTASTVTLLIGISAGAGNSVIEVAPNNSYPTSGVHAGIQLEVGGGQVSTELVELLLESTNFYYGSGGAGSTPNIDCYGWGDNI